MGKYTYFGLGEESLFASKNIEEILESQVPEHFFLVIYNIYAC
jgi:hypothetical protein